jgi:hypothetical protein
VPTTDRRSLGCWKLKSRASAERTLRWAKKKVRKGHRGKFPIFEGAVREVETGRFQIDAFKTWRNGERAGFDFNSFLAERLVEDVGDVLIFPVSQTGVPFNDADASTKSPPWVLC